MSTKSPERRALKKKLNNEIFSLIEQKWTLILDEPQNIYEITKYHREKLNDLPEIFKIKKELIDKIGYIPIFIFLNTFWCKYPWPGNYRIVEIGLLIIY